VLDLDAQADAGGGVAGGAGGGGAGGAGVGGSEVSFDKVMTDDRIRELEDAKRLETRKKKIDIMMARSLEGEARRLEREKNESREAIDRLQSIVRRQRLEHGCISVIQKQYRGHLGRKAARRWRLKSDELHAAHAMLTSAGVCVQRIFRGYSDRLYAVNKRTQMRQFISLMRVQESAQDEEMYWQTHPWSRFKKTQKEYIGQKLAEYRKKEDTLEKLSTEEQMELDKMKRDDAKLKEEEEGEEEEEGGEDGSEEEGGEDAVEAVMGATRRYSGKEHSPGKESRDSPGKDTTPTKVAAGGEEG
jgi:hypothetical protein